MDRGLWGRECRQLREAEMVMDTEWRLLRGLMVQYLQVEANKT